jgi:hypothetical protein
VGQYHNIKIAKRSFENVAQFKYLGMTVTNQNFVGFEVFTAVVMKSIIFGI